MLCFDFVSSTETIENAVGDANVSIGSLAMVSCVMDDSGFFIVE